MHQRSEASAPAHYITIRHGDMMPRHFFQDEGWETRRGPQERTMGETYKATISWEWNISVLINAEEMTCFKAMLIGLLCFVVSVFEINFELTSMTDKLQLYRYCLWISPFSWSMNLMNIIENVEQLTTLQIWLWKFEWVKFPGKIKKVGVIIPDDNITW